MKKTESVYSDKKEAPAWMKQDKYDLYGSRELHKASDVSNNNELDDKYAKYGISSNENRLNRIRKPERKRQKQPEPQTQDVFIDRYKSRNVTLPEQDVPEEPEQPQIRVEAYTNLNATNPNTTYQTFQSNIRKEGKDLNTIIKTHYNQRTYQSKHQGARSNSPIIKLRNFNNIIKYMLLGEYCKKSASPFRLLDCCCGKGGDLNKMEFITLDEYIGIDISDVSIREAFSRYNKNKKRFITGERDSRRLNFESFLATGDLFTNTIPEILEPNFPGIIDNCFPVDNVSIQFSLHYAFESESKIRCLINNVAKSLKLGGNFVGTVPSSDFIKHKLKDNELGEFGNDLYQVKFHEKPPLDGDFSDKPFGNGYNYSLKDAIDDVPEYLVPFETLRTICEQHEMVLKLKKNFIEFFNENIPSYFKKLNNHLIQSIKRSDGKYGVEGLEKEAVEFYLVFVFQKL